MKISYKLFFLLYFSAFILLLCGCTNMNASPTLTIDSPEGYEGILVSEASSIAKTSGYKEIFVSGEDKVKELIDLLNGKELGEASEKELQVRTDKLEEPGNYRILLYNKPSSDSEGKGIFSILFYKDGTLQVNQEGKTYFIDDPPKNLQSRLISEWGIPF